MNYRPFPLLIACALTAPLPAFSTGKTDTLLTDFSYAYEAQHWKTVNDNVMGGRSKGGFTVRENRLLFTGSTNTNGGGFSSIRRSLKPEQLAGSRALELRVKGDGRTYQASFETGERKGWRRIAYRVDFETTPNGEWQTVHIPFDALKASAWGQPVEDYTFDPANVRSAGIMIYDKKDGPFRLEVDTITLVPAIPQPTTTP